MWADLADDVAPASWRIAGERSDRDELAIQLAFRKLIRTGAPRVRVVAIPNGTHIASNYGRRKANLEGRSVGFPDVMCLWAHGDARANVVPQIAYIEFKAGRSGSVADAQAEWLTWLEQAGFACIVSRDELHAADWLRSLGAPFISREGRL